MKIHKKHDFQINGQKIKILRITKYLGLLIDEKLSFKLHLDTTKLKLNRQTAY